MENASQRVSVNLKLYFTNDGKGNWSRTNDLLSLWINALHILSYSLYTAKIHKFPDTTKLIIQ